MVDLSASLQDRFWSKVDRSGDCWLWTGGLAALFVILWSADGDRA